MPVCLVCVQCHATVRVSVKGNPCGSGYRTQMIHEHTHCECEGDPSLEWFHPVYDHFIINNQRQETDRLNGPSLLSLFITLPYPLTLYLYS